MKIIEVFADTSYQDIVITIAEQHHAHDIWQGPVGEDGRCYIRLLIGDEQRQNVMDALQGTLASSATARIQVTAVEASLPRPENNGEDKTKSRSKQSTTREELYNGIEKGSRLDSTFLILVFLSTVVVAIGLLEDNVAVVIGAMVIAPLLGPNIALALAAALGDTELMWKSLRTALAGMALALGLSVVIGMFWPLNVHSQELLMRTDAGLDSIVLAMASGAAAVLSLSTGLPSVLVGVMVAVALLPPTATMGLMLGAGKMEMAGGAGLLLAANIVAVNLSAKIAFLVKGIKPRTWLEKKKARQSMTAYILFWLISLGILLATIYLRHNHVQF